MSGGEDWKRISARFKTKIIKQIDDQNLEICYGWFRLLKNLFVDFTNRYRTSLWELKMRSSASNESLYT